MLSPCGLNQTREAPLAPLLESVSEQRPCSPCLCHGYPPFLSEQDGLCHKNLAEFPAPRLKLKKDSASLLVPKY